jgi:glutathione S-transferase
MPEKPTLHVCHIDQGGPKIHACRRAHDALVAAGVDHEKVVFAKNKPFGLFTSGRRPELKAMSGQEKLPVLELRDGTTVNGSAAILAWAKANGATA